MNALASSFFDRAEQRVSAATGLLEWVSHLLAASNPNASRQLRLPSLDLKHQHAVLRVQDDEVSLALAQRLARQVSRGPEPRERVQDDEARWEPAQRLIYDALRVVDDVL